MRLISTELGLAGNNNFRLALSGVNASEVFELAKGSEKPVPFTQKTTPTIKRIDKAKLEQLYLLDPVIFNSINKIVQIIMSAGYKLIGSDESVSFFEEFLDSIGSRGGELEWDSLLELNFKFPCIYGDSWNELIYNKKKNMIVDLDVIDPKKMDYAKNSSGKIILDNFMNPVGYVEKLPMDYSAINKIKPPANVFLNPNEIFLPPEKVAHYKLYTVGDSFYGIGLIEPIYNTALRKLNMEQALANSWWMTGFPLKKGKVGDLNHEPTEEHMRSMAENIKNLDYKSTVVLPYYADVELLESSKPEKRKEILNYFIEQEITGIGLPKAYATGSGEATNRACYIEDTEVLTENGWKHYWEVEDGEKIAAYNPKTKELLFEVPAGLYVYNVDEQIIELEGKRTSFAVTEDHKLLVKECRQKEYQLIKANEVQYSEVSFITAPEHFKSSKNMEKVIINGCSEIKQGSQTQLGYDQQLEIPISDFLEFLGYYLSEGGLSLEPAKENGRKIYLITFVQKDDDKAEKMEKCFSRLGVRFSPYRSKDGLHRWNMHDKRLWTYLKNNAGYYCNNKRIPRDKLKILFDSLMLGDGYWAESGKSGYLYTVSKELADNFQELAFKLGFSAIQHIISPRGNRQVGYRVQFCENKSNVIKWDSKIKKRYVGKVFCFSVSTGVFVTRLNGKIAIQGNTLARQEYLFKLTLKDIVRRVTRVIETKIFKPIAEMEKLPDYPKLRWGEIAIEELDSKSKRLIGYVKSNIIKPDLELEKFIRKIEDLPVKKKQGD